MQNQISVFNFRTTEVRTVVRDGEAWFVASDIAKALNYRDAEKMARMLDDDERGTHIVGTVSTNQHGTASEQSNTVIVINESGMYHAVLKSRKPEAKPFRKWVTSEVLPTIRKTGKYEAAPYSVNPGDTLTKTQADTLRDLLTSTVKKLPQEKQASAMIRGWSKLKAHFGTGYRQIPQSEFVEALSIVARHCVTVHALEGELLEAEPKHDSLNETVAKWVKQIEAGNGTPIEVFEPLVRAVLKKRQSAGHEAMESLILDLLSKQRFTLSFIQLEHGLLKPQIHTHHVNAQTLVPQAVINDIRDRSFNFFPDALIPDLINAIGYRIAGANRSAV